MQVYIIKNDEDLTINMIGLNHYLFNVRELDYKLIKKSRYISGVFEVSKGNVVCNKVNNREYTINAGRNFIVLFFILSLFILLLTANIQNFNSMIAFFIYFSMLSLCFYANLKFEEYQLKKMKIIPMLSRVNALNDESSRWLVGENKLVDKAAFVKYKILETIGVVVIVTILFQIAEYIVSDVIYLKLLLHINYFTILAFVLISLFWNYKRGFLVIKDIN